MSTSYVAGLLPAIRKILETSDLSVVSAKAVRKELINRGEDETTIRANRSSIDEHIGRIYEELTSAASPSLSSPDVPLTKSELAHPQSSQPEPLRKKAVKREVKVETDEEMAARLQREFDAVGNGRASRSARGGRAVKRKKVRKVKSAARVGSDGEERPRKRRAGNDAFNKELILSDALSELVGEPRLSRPQTVKRIWDYVKARDLQDQTDKRYILCDEPLRSVFHTDRLHMFTMNKVLVQHFRDPAEVIIKDEGRPVVPKAEGRPPVLSDSEDDDEDGDSSVMESV